MPRRHETFAFDPLNHRPDECWRWCKIHYWWDFAHEIHVPYPNAYNILSSRHGWENITVFCGPPAYYPRRAKS